MEKDIFSIIALKKLLIHFFASTFGPPPADHSPLLPILCLLLGVCLIFSPLASASDTEINCDAHQGVCSQSLGNRTISLEIMPRPVTAMQDLVFKVSVSGNPPAQAPYIDLGMPAMKMGPNRVLLTPAGLGHWEGKGVIVRCKSGRRTWFADVIVPGAGDVKFVFDVIY